MSKYLLETTASCIRAEANAVADVLLTIRSYKETDIPEFKNRVNEQPVDLEQLTDDFTQWLTQEENLGCSYLTEERDGIRMVLLAEPLRADHFKTYLQNQDLDLVVKATLGIHDVRFRNTVVLALERNCAMGKGYTVLRAWTNFQPSSSISILKVD